MLMPRCSLLSFVALVAIILATSTTNHAFVNRPILNFGHGTTSVNYRTAIDNDVEPTTSSTAAPLALESFLWDDELTAKTPLRTNGKKHNGRQAASVAELAEKVANNKDINPALVEFVPSDEYQDEDSKLLVNAPLDDVTKPDDHYPFAAMLQGSAPYIASHLEETVVFYIPGEWLHKPNQLFDSFLQDVALSRLMGMKIVLVADCRMEADGSCCAGGYDYAHECHNSLRVTTDCEIRQIEEEAGYIRFEVERKMNRFLKQNLVCGAGEEGNVLGGNYYQARAFGTVRGEDFQHTGFVQQVYKDNIQHALDNNDVVLLTTVGCSSHGDSVNVNGQHLAAAVASSLKAHKLIYMANQGSVLSLTNDRTFLQEIPLSFAQELCDYHKVRVHKTGFANFEQARHNLEPRGVELLLNLAWASWAVDNGVTRAHIVNPKDGALLEELFTSKNGANTCLYHDDEIVAEEEDWLSAEDADDWNEFFAEAASQEANVNGAKPE